MQKIKSPKSIMQHAASMHNPPKGYGIKLGVKVASYRSERFDYWTRQGLQSPELFERIEADIIAKFGNPI